jgi:O-acetylserine/cysteine efflux transporter
MNTNRRLAVAALVAAGLLWGTTVPLSKLALEWLPTGWLTAARFGLAAAILLPVVRTTRPGPRTAARPGLRTARSPRVLISGAIGYGGSVIVQNAGIARTSVTHAALLIGAVPVMVAVVAALWQHTVARPVAWAGFAISLGGVGLVTAGASGGGATLAGDGLVLASLLLSAVFTVGQARLLRGRDPVAVTAVQFLGAALGALAFSVITEGVPSAPTGASPAVAVAALVAGGTLLPFTLFAYGQSRVSAEVAGAFYNLEPLVGAAAGAVVFGNPVGIALVGGGAAILAGIGLSSLPLVTAARGRPADESDKTAGRTAAAHHGAPGRVIGREVRSGFGDVRGREHRGQPRSVVELRIQDAHLGDLVDGQAVDLRRREPLPISARRPPHTGPRPAGSARRAWPGWPRRDGRPSSRRHAAARRSERCRGPRGARRVRRLRVRSARGGGRG